VRNELSLQILQYLFDRAGRQIQISDLAVQLGKDIHSLRPAIEDLKAEGFINEEEYRVEILPSGRHFAQSRWV
jgi:DNA-binding MarR family transcriptional regulator